MIAIWSGAIVDIPSGFALCNGSNGTPDLRDRFVVGAGSTYAVGVTGGAATHTHTVTNNPHSHTIPGGLNIGSGANFGASTDPTTDAGSSAAGSSLPPYYALALIMKL